MRKVTLTRIILIVISVMILIGSITSLIMLSTISDGNSIKVKLKNNEPEQIEFSKLKMEDNKAPYAVLLKARQEGRYKVFFSFVGAEIDEDVMVQISLGEEVVCDLPLSTLCEGSAVSFDCDIAKRDATQVSVIYYLPEGAQEEISDLSFDIRILAQKQ